MRKRIEPPGIVARDCLPAESVISYRDVSLSFSGTSVLEGFDLDVSAGEKVLVFGKSGSGKSSLLKMPLGFVRPSAGSVFLEGRPFDRYTAWKARRRLAYVSQDFDLGEGSVSGFLNGVMSFKANAGVEPVPGRSTAEVLDLLRLDEGIPGKDMSELSGGERQRVALATAILLQRDLFLLDEATSALDAVLKTEVVEYFASLEGATVLAVSHDINWLIGDRFRVVKLGEA